jgi:hypothetical protein
MRLVVSREAPMHDTSALFGSAISAILLARPIKLKLTMRLQSAQ